MPSREEGLHVQRPQAGSELPVAPCGLLRRSTEDNHHGGEVVATPRSDCSPSPAGNGGSLRVLASCFRRTTLLGRFSLGQARG